MKELIRQYISRLEFDEKRSVISAEVVFPREFKGFKGHFPKRPLLPAVVQLAAARVILEEYLGRPLVMGRIRRCKFRGMVGPDEPIRFTMEIEGPSETEPREIQVRMEITDAEARTVAQCTFQVQGVEGSAADPDGMNKG